MPDFNIDWTASGPGGEYTSSFGAQNISVGITTDMNTAGQSAAGIFNGTPSEPGLWVDGLTGPVTTRMVFDTPVTNLEFEVFDIDQSAGNWDERLTIIALDANGNQVPVTFSDLDGLHSVTGGNVLNADGSSSSATDTSGALDSVSVDIAGPIVSLTVIFDVGESEAATGAFGISNIGFDAGSFGNETVEGTAIGEQIDTGYLLDPQGDRIDNGDGPGGSDDDVVVAGGGDDSVFAGDGNDIVYGEAGGDLLSGGIGNDTLFGGDDNDTMNGDEGDDVAFGGDGADLAEMGTGNDLFYGGAGDDRVNGDFGDDTLHGGTGDDFLRGSFGRDTIYSGGAGDGDDYLWGGFNDDTFIFENGFGNDIVDAENQDETNGDTLDLRAVTDNLTIDLRSGAQGAGGFSDGTSNATFDAVENIVLSSGTDTLLLADGSGADRVIEFTAPVLNPDGTYTGFDQVDASELTRDFGTTGITSRDVTVSDDGLGNALLSFPSGDSLLLVGVSPADVTPLAALEAMGFPPPDGLVLGTDNTDFMLGGYSGDPDGDLIDSGDAYLPGEVGDDDIIYAFGGVDVVFSGLGNDEVFGGDGDDFILGGEGNDEIFGEGDADTIDGETGDDTITGGEGADTLNGGDDADTFLGASNGDVIDGGEGGTDNDTLDLRGITGDFNVVPDALNSENGIVQFLDGGGAVTGQAAYFNIENVVTCFTPDSRIMTTTGARAARDLCVGDRVLTRDNGQQKIRWIGRRTLDTATLMSQPHLRPVLVRKGALGGDLPERDMLISPNHRILIADARTSLFFGSEEMLVASKHLTDAEGISSVIPRGVTYLHFMFDRHEVVLSDGAWSESFHPGTSTLDGMASDQRHEIYELFPELRSTSGRIAYRTARPTLKKHEARLLVA